MFPKLDSIADKIGQYLHKHGKCSREQIYLSLEGRGHQRESIRISLRDMVDGSQVIDEADGFTLCDILRRHYSVVAAEAYIGQITPPRTPSEFKPLKVMPWAANADRLRDWGYKNGSTDFRIGYVA